MCSTWTYVVGKGKIILTFPNNSYTFSGYQTKIYRWYISKVITYYINKVGTLSH